MRSAKLQLVSSGGWSASGLPVVGHFSFVQRRLTGVQRIDTADLAEIQALEANALAFAPGTDVVGEGDAPGTLYIQADGWAFRYRLIEDGRRQIFDFVLPGDWYDLNTLSGRPHASSVGTITPCLAIPVQAGKVHAWAASQPRLLDAIETMRCEANARLEETLTMLGRLTACEAMVRFLVRTYRRLDAVGLVEDRAAVFPLTQEMMGDHLGLSTVHVNRTMRVLKTERGITIANGLLTIEDPEALRSEFDDPDDPPRRLAS